MIIKRDTILNALQARIVALCATRDPAPTVGERNCPLAQSIDVAVSDPARIRVVLTDGEAEEPDTLMGGDAPIYDHNGKPELELICAHPDEAVRGPALSELMQAISDDIDSDPTLGGTCDNAVAKPSDPQTLHEEGAPPVKAAVMPIDILYSSASALG